MAERTAEPVSMPTGESRCAIGPAKCRRMNIRLLV